ncbi:MAG: hypothetical protein ACRC6R_09450 [Bacteroidales bacterium]
MSPKYIRRFRNKRGFGVHSPFAFNLITQVMRGKLTYGNVNQLDEAIEFVCNKSGKHINKKKFHILCKIINHLQPKYVLEIGSYYGLSTIAIAQTDSNPHISLLIQRKGDVEYINHHINRAKISNIQIIDNIPLASDNRKFEFIYLHGAIAGKTLLETIQIARSISTHNGVILIDRLTQSQELRNEWKDVLRSGVAQMIIDQKKHALLFLDTALNRKNYFI